MKTITKRMRLQCMISTAVVSLAALHAASAAARDGHDHDAHDRDAVKPFAWLELARQDRAPQRLDNGFRPCGEGLGRRQIIHA